jgi:hypothetical protein
MFARHPAFHLKHSCPAVNPPNREFLRLLSSFALFIALAGVARADINNLPAGYSIRLVSSNLPSTRTSSISQLAFKPGDLTHVYAARDTLAKVSRYDYDPITGLLSNEVMIATNTDRRELIGLGFHSTNLYVTFDYGGTRTVAPGDGRIARYFNPNANGVYQSRHDFVHSIDKGEHDVNMIKFKGNSLYVGIGAASRTGDPARDNIYTMTIARIVDVNQIVSLTNQIGPNFKGPINYLPNPIEWMNTNGADGQLRYFASGFRNPFGINFDPDGDLWVSANGNSDVGFFSDDLLYKKVFLGAQGDFPPPAFGFTNYITGTPIAPFVNLGFSTAVTGFDFIREGPDAGKVLVAESGANAAALYNVGRDLLLIDSLSGSSQQIYQFTTNGTKSVITDCLRDPFGRFLVSDYTRNNLWLLTPPLPRPQISATASNGVLRLNWPLTGVEYRLEETSNPAVSNSWQTSAAAIQISTSAIEAQVMLTNSARYFRLKR